LQGCRNGYDGQDRVSVCGCYGVCGRKGIMGSIGYECGERNIMGCGGGVFTSLGSRMVSFSVDLDLSM